MKVDSAFAKRGVLYEPFWIGPEDIPKDKVNSRARRVEGVKYLVTDRPEWMDMKPIYAVIRKAREAARKGMKR